MIEKRVLVLNRCYLPVHITSVKRAISLVFLGAARGVDPEYQVYSWEDLVQISENSELFDTNRFHLLRTIHREIPVPRVIVLNDFDRLPQRSIRFSRTHVFMRDRYTCQYCGNEYPKAKLNLDHVMPRSRGGKTSWDNLVTSCHTCNRTKANRTPHEANMPLLSTPKRPSGSFGLVSMKSIHDSWAPFLFSAT